MANDGDEGERLLRSVVRAHGHAVVSCLERLERDEMIREEVFADVVFLAYQRIDELCVLSEGELRSWLLRTARYLGRNASRRAATRRRLVELLNRERLPFAASAEDDFADHERDAAYRARSVAIRRALDATCREHRQLLVLDALGWSGPRISAELGISHQAARSRLMRARAAFATEYTSPAVEDFPDADQVPQ